MKHASYTVLFIVAAFSFLLFAADIPDTILKDRLQLGSSSTDDKELIFDIGQGASNPRLRADYSGQTLQISNDGTNFANIAGKEFLDQDEIKFFEQSGNGNEYVGFTAPDSIGTTLTFKWPATDGTVNQLLKTDGNKNLGWISSLVDPMTTRGDLLYRNAVNATDRFPIAGTADTVLASDGTDPSWSSSPTVSSISTDTVSEKTGNNGVNVDTLLIKDGKLETTDSVDSDNITDDTIVNDDVNSAAAIAASKISGTAMTLNATETATGVKTFSNGIKVGTSGDLIDEYEEGTFNAVWNAADWFGGDPGTVTIEYVRWGKMVTLMIPSFIAASNSVSMSIGGLPNSIEALRSPSVFVQTALVTDNSVKTQGCIGNSNSGTFNITFKSGTTCTNFNAGGTKGLAESMYYSYKLP
jgi:hypothetical protein